MVCLLAMQMLLGFREAGEARGAAGKPHQSTSPVCEENDEKFPRACAGRAALGHGAAQLRDADFLGSHPTICWVSWESER